MSKILIDEATVKLALEALEYIEHNYMILPAPAEKAITALREILAEQPAPVAKPHEQEPVEYQMRMRPTWEVSSWSDWKKCSRDAAEDYTKTPKLHDWEYETRKLYAQPIPQAVTQIPKEHSSNESAYQRGYLDGMAKRPQPLTDEQVMDIVDVQRAKVAFDIPRVGYKVARAIEAAHGIKEKNT